MDRRRALIVGAGIGGLAAGVALRRAGWQVRIFERAPSAREVGFALLLAPNAVAALRALGVADDVIAGGWVATRGHIRRADGRLLRVLDTSKAQTLLGEPTVMVLRPVLHGALLNAVGPDVLALGREVTGFAMEDDRPVLTLADGDRVPGDVLIGADGVASAVRRALHPGEPSPRPTGLLALRGVAYGAERHLAGASGAQYFCRAIEAGIARASDTAVYSSRRSSPSS